MRLYLSSFRLGDQPQEWLRLLQGSRRIAVVANAVDSLPADEYREAVECELADLRGLELEPTLIDLRDYFGDRDGFADAIAAYDAVWVRGGNCFVLRAAMALSGADRVLVDLLEADRICYAGYSAGPAVLSPSLRGIELVDPVDQVEQTYGVEPIWDGLRILQYAFVPHFDSAPHPETEAIGRVVHRYETEGTPFRTIRDGQAIVVDGADHRLV